MTEPHDDVHDAPFDDADQSSRQNEYDFSVICHQSRYWIYVISTVPASPLGVSGESISWLETAIKLTIMIQ